MGSVVLGGGYAQDDKMGSMTGKSVDFGFDPGALTLEDVARIAGDIWSGLAFDEEARAQIKRDGLVLDGVRLTGPNPYAVEALAEGVIRVSVEPGPAAEALIDLWRIHFMRSLRPRNLAA